MASKPVGKGFGFGGFTVKPKEGEKPLPSKGAMPARGMRPGLMKARIGGAPPTKKPKVVESRYHDEGETGIQSRLMNAAKDGRGGGGSDSEDSDDPLDAFMAGIEVDLAKKPKKEKKIVRDDLEAEDDHESYFKYVESLPQTAEDEDEVLVEYDEDGNPIVPEKSKIIDPLPPIDHTTMPYKPFEKFFFEEHDDIRSMNAQAINDLRKALGVKVSGASPTKPVSSFGHFKFDESLMNVIRKLEYTKPTPIQCQAVPSALSGRDIIGIAKTGSGKTAAFLWPLLVHLLDQDELIEGEGPIGLICAPTRELCQQIYHEAKRFGKAYNLNVCCVYGGGSKWEQSQALKTAPEILVCTPGRMIDMIKIKATNFHRVTFLVIDEADRMFDMGFEPQVRSICNHIRPDRQCLMFSATFRKKVERLARDVLTDPIRIVVGDLGEANEDITQVVRILKTEDDKWTWLHQHLVQFTSTGSVLIFVTRKLNAEEIAGKLKAKDFQVVLLHGDMGQADRDSVITQFKKREVPVMVATDVAARGLDISSIRTVVNYDVARDIDTHTHRIGRTGRAGEKGHAYTLMTSKDNTFAGDLVRNLEQANQPVQEDLMKLAMTNSWFRKSRFKHGKGGGGFGGGGGGGGPRGRGRSRAGLGADRPGLGTSDGAAPEVDTDDIDEDDTRMHKLTSSVTGTMARMQAMAQSQSGAGGRGAGAGGGAGGGAGAGGTGPVGPMGARSFGAGGRAANMRTAFAAGYNRFVGASNSAYSSTMSGDNSTSSGGINFTPSSSSTLSSVPQQAPSHAAAASDQASNRKRKSRWE
eukprot:scpid63344/ scgid11290/ ATP-dependent RNA helicase DDX42; DEAD box protein 42